jgi:hypothetical protein
MGGAVIGSCVVRNAAARWRIAIPLVWVWAGFMVAMTFGTASGGGMKLNLRLLDVMNTVDMRDFILNVLLFVPLGIVIAVLHGRWSVALVAGFCVSFLVEFLQFVLASGRTSDINDLIANTSGTILGYTLTTMIFLTITRRPTQ